MSVERQFKWICETCGVYEYMTTYGLPDGWKYHPQKRNERSRHTCGVCTDIERINMIGQAQAFTDDTVLDFSPKHKGKKLKDIPASWLLYMYDQSGFKRTRQQLCTYIDANRDLLEDQARGEDRDKGWT